MAEMKTLTINGKTYTVNDPDSVSFETVQDLTEDQKAQARENIGAAHVDDSKLGADAWSSKKIADTCANAIKGTVSGERIQIDDVSPMNHAIGTTIHSKNLFRFEDLKDVGGRSGISKLESGLRVTPDSGWLDWLQWSTAICTWMPISAFDGQTLTISAGMTASGDYVPRISVAYVSADIQTRRVIRNLNASGSVSFTVDSSAEAAKGCQYIALYFYMNASDHVPEVPAADDYVDYTNIQIEVGTAATAYAPFIADLSSVEVYAYDKYEANGSTYKAGEEIEAFYPTTIISTDTAGAVITAEYSKDTNKVIERLVQAIISLGGNV